MKNHSPSTLFFGIFYLREQLHTYMDVFTKYQYKISCFLGSENVDLILKEKKRILKEVDRVFWQMKYAPIRNPAIFAPLKNPWLTERQLEHCNAKESMVELFLETDRDLMKWCCWFLTEQPDASKTSRLLLEIIDLTKAESKLLFEIHSK